MRKFEDIISNLPVETQKELKARKNLVEWIAIIGFNACGILGFLGGFFWIH